jgi:glycosyltransferase involved in cell wall biosynthesis
MTEPLDLAWSGARPQWLEDEEAVRELESVTFVEPAEASVVHLAPGAPTTVAQAKAAPRQPGVVVDLGASPGATRPDLGAADAILVDSAWEAGRLTAREPAAAGKVEVAPAPLDLAQFAPESVLLETHGARLKRFKRYHRLGEPCVLFVGPYTPDGGLDVAIEAAHRLRERFADVRLAAIPSGPIDHTFLDKCEMRALGLGHRGIIEWQTEREEIPFWYATASIVCVPWRSPAGPPTPPRLAAAAGRPFVGSDIGPFRSDLPRETAWATLVPPGDVQALVEVCAALFDAPEDARGRGVAARTHAEQRFSPGVAARRLAEGWRRVASDRAAATLRVA